MDMPGDLYMTPVGVCFVPDTKLTRDELIEFLKLGSVSLCDKHSVDTDWKHLGTINK